MGLAKRTSSASLVCDIKRKEPACFGQHEEELPGSDRWEQRETSRLAAAKLGEDSRPNLKSEQFAVRAPVRADSLY